LIKLQFKLALLLPLQLLLVLRWRLSNKLLLLQQ
jgi:hypothetical protein